MMTAEVVAYPQNFMAVHGDRLVDLGYHIIPIMPGSKAPGVYRGGSWSGYRDWTKHCDRPTKAWELSVWRGYPGCGIGVACGNTVALDIDVKDHDVALAIEAAAMRTLGETPAVRVGLAPKRLLVYRAKGVVRPIKRHPLEILARGNQFVAYAIHPITQKPYEWINEPLDQIMIERLPAVTHEQCERFLADAEAMLPVELRQRRLGGERALEHYANPDPAGTLEAVAEALEHIPNDDLAYDDWVYIGLALKGALGGDGLPLWKAWSALSKKNNMAVTVEKWGSFRPTGIGAGTIYHYAFANGWSPSPGLELNSTRAALCDGVDITAFVESVTAEQTAGLQTGLPTSDFSSAVPALAPPLAVTAPPSPVTAPLPAAPGLLGDLTRWIVSSAPSPQPLLSLGASIAFIGALLGQRWKLADPDTRSNVYIAALAGSGSGKEHPRSMLKLLSGAAGLKGYISEEIGSAQGLMANVWRHNCRVYMIDEIGHFIGGVIDRRAAQHRSDILPKLTVLWSSASTYMAGRELAEQRDESAHRMDVDQPCVCVYGSTVPDVWWRALAGSNVSDGSLARWLVFQTDVDYPDPPAVLADPTAGMPALVDRCMQLITGAERPDALQIATATLCVQQPPGQRLPNGAMSVAVKPSPTPKIVPVTLPGEALMGDLCHAGLMLKREHAGLPTASVAARWYEMVRRLALIAAVAEDPISPMLDTQHLEWARGIVDASQGMMLAGVREFVADTQHEADAKRVLRSVGSEWESASAICRKNRWISRRDRDDILAQLVESGDIEAKREKTTGRPLMLYRRVR